MREYICHTGPVDVLVLDLLVNTSAISVSSLGPLRESDFHGLCGVHTVVVSIFLLLPPPLPTHPCNKVSVMIGLVQRPCKSCIEDVCSKT